MPQAGKRTGLRLAVAHDAGDHEIRIVEHRSERVAQRISEFATLMNRAWTLGRCVAWNAAGKRKLGLQLAQPGLVY